uniref:Uncharacterized protein n=1 Tax=Vespula pensylvanica TaxID=30213 RepID=A0A834NKS3_VESPE|nr:hypothetical protein H0235_013700 [Vespula pensylvanica]
MQCYDGDENDLPNELLYESYLGWLDPDPKMHLAFNLENYFVHWPNHEKDTYINKLTTAGKNKGYDMYKFTFPMAWPKYKVVFQVKIIALHVEAMHEIRIDVLPTKQFHHHHRKPTKTRDHPRQLTNCEKLTIIFVTINNDNIVANKSKS